MHRIMKQMSGRQRGKKKEPKTEHKERKLRTCTELGEQN
jgi:hypothetical protein